MLSVIDIILTPLAIIPVERVIVGVLALVGMWHGIYTIRDLYESAYSTRLRIISLGGTGGRGRYRCKYVIIVSSALPFKHAAFCANAVEESLFAINCFVSSVIYPLAKLMLVF